MEKIKKTFDFTLESPIEIHKGGEIIKSDLLTLKAPSKKNRKQTVKIKQLFFQAMSFHTSKVTDQDKKNQASGDESMTGAEIMVMLYMSDIDMEVFDERFSKLFLSPGVVMIDDDVQLTEQLFEKISDDDLDKMVGGYLEHFLLPSLMNE